MLAHLKTIWSSPLLTFLAPGLRGLPLPPDGLELQAWAGSCPCLCYPCCYSSRSGDPHFNLTLVDLANCLAINASFEDQFHKLWLFPLQLFWWSIYKLRLKLASFFNSREDNQCDPHQLEVIETWLKYRNQPNNPTAEKQFQDSCVCIFIQR